MVICSGNVIFEPETWKTGSGLNRLNLTSYIQTVRWPWSASQNSISGKTTAFQKTPQRFRKRHSIPQNTTAFHKTPQHFNLYGKGIPLGGTLLVCDWTEPAQYAPHICSETGQKLNINKPQTDCLCHGEYSRCFIYVCIMLFGRSSYRLVYPDRSDLHSENTHFKRFFACCLQTCHSINS